MSEKLSYNSWLRANGEESKVTLQVSMEKLQVSLAVLLSALQSGITMGHSQIYRVQVAVNHLETEISLLGTYQEMT